MATDSIDNQAVTDDKKPTFDAAQQAKVNELIRDATARGGAEARTAAETFKTEAATLKSQLEEAKAELTRAKTPSQKKEANADVDALKDRITEMENVHKTVTTELENTRKLAQQRETEVKSAKEATINVRKESVLTQAVGKINPFEIDTVVGMIKDSVVWDDSKQAFVVVDPVNGQPRINSSFEPMKLDEFIAEFASRKPYLIRGGVKTGTGSSESGRFDVANNGRYSVEQIFGPKSDSRLANDLAKKDINEYRRLRAIAVDSGVLSGPMKR